jgi:hypothetical protein
MKKFFLSLLGFLSIAALAIFLFRAPLMDFVLERMTADMFVATDTDGFAPGLSIGEPFPHIEARYQGRTLRDTSQFIHDKGMVFIINRSVDW